jgi:hypothetical protein
VWSTVAIPTATDTPDFDVTAADTPNTPAVATRALMTMAGFAASSAGRARERARTVLFTDADRTIDGPVYRSTFVAVPAATPVIPVVAASSAVKAWLLALLPIPQLAIIMALGPLRLPPGVGYALLVGPSLALLLVAALRRALANDRDEQPTAPIVFAAVPPLYRLASSVTLTTACMTPVITWLLLEGIAAAVLLFA